MQTQTQTPDQQSKQQQWRGDSRHKRASVAAPGLLDLRPQTAQLRAMQAMIDGSAPQRNFQAIQARMQPNRTGLPDQLKTGVESLSGIDMGHVQVHYNSDKPAQLNAHAYAQGSEIHLAPGQERHLPHEAWHVVQQAKGTVSPTTMLAGGAAVNDDATLEADADRMGTAAAEFRAGDGSSVQRVARAAPGSSPVVQRVAIHVGDASRELADLDAMPQETFYEGSYDELNEMWEQLVTLSGITEEDVALANNVKYKVHNAYHIWMNRERAEGDWNETHEQALGEGDTLHDRVHQVIAEAMTNTGAIAGMDSDDIFDYRPETQLSHCLDACRGESEAALATSLYTSYLYQPINRLFRGGPADPATRFGRLVSETARILGDHLNAQDETELVDRRYRVELKSGWIDEGEDEIHFAAPTSTQIDLEGIQNMWGDVANGTFGEFDNIALLILEGSARKVRPGDDIKYFDTETEDVLAPATEFTVADRYTVNGDIPGIGPQAIRVFLLRRAMPAETPLPDPLTFEDIVPPAVAEGD